MKFCDKGKNKVVHDEHEWRDSNGNTYYCPGIKGVPTQKTRK